MIDDYAQPGWAEAHEKFAADLAAGLSRLARWLLRRVRAKAETPAIIDARRDREPQSVALQEDARP